PHHRTVEGAQLARRARAPDHRPDVATDRLDVVEADSRSSRSRLRAGVLRSDRRAEVLDGLLDGAELGIRGRSRNVDPAERLGDVPRLDELTASGARLLTERREVRHRPLSLDEFTRGLGSLALRALEHAGNRARERATECAATTNE